MAQEEHTSRCSNNNSSGGGGNGNGNGGGGIGGGGGGRCSKKLKNKKVPQRGMGVAQLEKIILEEHQKKDASVLTHNNNNSVISPSNSSSNLSGIQKFPNFRQAAVSGSSVTIPPPPPPPLPPNHGPLGLKTDGVNVNSVSKPTNLIGVGGGSWSRLWSDGEKGQSQSYGMDHPRYTAPATFTANLGGLPYESNPPIWPPAPNLMLQRSQHIQQPCSSSMMNVSANTSSLSSSSVMSFQIEPPSNQSYCGNNFQPLWPDEEKIVGMKRSYPFALEDMPIPSFHCKFPSAYVSRSDDYASCSNGGGTTSIEPAHSAFRDNCSSSGAISDPTTKKFIDENQVLTRDFLKLAPPQASQSRSISKESLCLSPCIGEQPQFERLPLQKDQSKDMNHLSGRSGSNTQPLQPFLSFFPAAKKPMGQPGNSNGEAGESVDLNLKL